jgi:intracellular sulfur oxidation DsrE/DsrF family protein
MNYRRHRIIAAGLVALALAPTLACADVALLPPLIPGYGEVTPIESAGERPDPAVDYKIVLNATKGGGGDSLVPFLDKAAKVANLLAQSGVPAGNRHVVVILQAAATTGVLNAAGLKARGMANNPNADLIAKLNAAGVSVRVCGQALAGAKIARSEVLPGVQVDLSALTTVSTLQLKGYALLVD